MRLLPSCGKVGSWQARRLFSHVIASIRGQASIDFGKNRGDFCRRSAHILQSKIFAKNLGVYSGRMRAFLVLGCAAGVRFRQPSLQGYG
jgi:hypothetical protein